MSAERERLYWRTFQNPASRVQSPEELLEGAREALRGFKNPHIRASALCVIIYRYLETPALRGKIRADRVLDTARGAAKALQQPVTLPDMRWYLSLNMARANLMVLLGQDSRAVKILRLNLAMLQQALLLGQPFTNVVKSACALIGIAKNREVGALSVPEALEMLDRFASLGAEVSANYRYENHWVYEELALIYRLLFELAKCRKAVRSSQSATCRELLADFPDSAVPAAFLSALRQPAPLAISPEPQADDDPLMQGEDD